MATEPTPKPFLAFKGVDFAFDPQIPVLKDLSLALGKGEIVALLGASGCGKSTLLRLAAGLLVPTGGLLEKESDAVSFVFQDAALLPWQTVEQNVALPLKLRGAEDKGGVLNALETVGLKGFEDRYPQNLSGGQRMRVSIARALAAGGDLYCFDEPFAALDELLRFELNDLILDLSVRNNWSTLFVTHSLYEASYLADRIIVLDQGRVSAEIIPDRHGQDRAAWRQSDTFVQTVKTCEDALRREGVS